MDTQDLFNSGIGSGTGPNADPSRQAVNALRGYEYQVLSAALAWLDVEEDERLYLEVAEDYAVIAEQVLQTFQIRDRKVSGPITLNSQEVKGAIQRFVDLVERNPHCTVHLRYLTTAEIGSEKSLADHFEELPGLKYWKLAARPSGRTEVAPLRSIMQSETYPTEVRQFSEGLDDESFRRDLLGRIHWHCGRPDVGTLREELEARLVVVGRDRFDLPHAEAKSLASHIVQKVLEKSTAPEVEARVLTRADLYSVIDAATQRSVPRRVLEEMITGASAGIGPSFDQALASQGSPSTSGASWIIDGCSLPDLNDMIPRPALESASSAALREFGAVVIVGGSGVGKSVLARTVAGSKGRPFVLVDFQDSDPAELCGRIDLVFSRLGGLRTSALILESLNHHGDPNVLLSLARLIETGRSHGIEALITSYRAPSPKALGQLGINGACIVRCKHFSEEETETLVRELGGDPKTWSRLAYAAGAAGHPQLTHALLSGVASQGWQVRQITDILGGALADLETTRDEARRRVVSVLPEGTRDLLYRLSITTGKFDRSLALRIAAIDPPVSRVGEHMDQLLGPWVESLGRDLFRVSPLASRFGQEMLPAREQEHIHRAIATEMLSRRRGTPDKMNIILVHSIAGKSGVNLRTLAVSVLASNPRTVERLGDSQWLRFFQTEGPIYADDPVASALLRIAQFRLVAAVRDWGKMVQVCAAVFREIGNLPCCEERSTLESLAAVSVLCTMGVGNHLENWVDLLVGFVESRERNRSAQASLDSLGSAIGGGGPGALFSIGGMDLTCVARLEQVIDKLDSLEPSLRMALLAPVHPSMSDYSLFINRPWQLEESKGEFDAESAALCYKRMARKTRSWALRALSLQCVKAQAVLLGIVTKQMIHYGWPMWAGSCSSSRRETHEARDRSAPLARP